MLLMKKRSL